MMHAPSRITSRWLFLSIACASCGCQGDSQWVHSLPRTTAMNNRENQVSHDPTARATAPVPKVKPLPPSSGIDVPIIESN